MIKNIILDMGNVLMDFDPEVSLRRFLDNDADRDIIRNELFHGPEWLMGDEGILKNAERYEPVSKRVPQRLHPQLKNIVEHWNDCMQPIAGATEFCDCMKEKGYQIYVLSNADDTFFDYFPRFKEISWFDGVTVSSTIRIVKPNLDIYEYFLEHYHLTADECLFIDDRLENVVAAECVGMHGFVFKGNYDDIIQKHCL